MERKATSEVAVQPAVLSSPVDSVGQPDHEHEYPEGPKLALILISLGVSTFLVALVGALPRRIYVPAAS